MTITTLSTVPVTTVPAKMLRLLRGAKVTATLDTRTAEPAAPPPKETKTP